MRVKELNHSGNEDTGNVELQRRREVACQRAWLSVAESGNRHPLMSEDRWTWSVEELSLRLAQWRQQHEAKCEAARQAEAELATTLVRKPKKDTKPIQLGKDIHQQVLALLIQQCEGKFDGGAFSGKPRLGSSLCKTIAKNNRLGLTSKQVLDIWRANMPERMKMNDAEWHRLNKQGGMDAGAAQETR